ncbi:MAG: hypothetical protein ACXWUU_15505 [Burkholderiales bacterium]
MYRTIRRFRHRRHAPRFSIAVAAGALAASTALADSALQMLHRVPDSGIAPSFASKAVSRLAAAPPAAAHQAARNQGEPSVSGEARLKRNRLEIDHSVGDAEFRAHQAKGAKGDGNAAFKVAQMYKRGSNGVPRDKRRMLQWLLHASSLDSGAASYQLYLHYLDLKLDRDAVYFENRALEQGFTPPPRLDPRRG